MATGLAGGEPMNVRDLAPGLYADVRHEDYHSRHLGMVSKSVLDLVNRSPAHYKAWLDGRDEEETPALSFGSAFHCATLEPERFAKLYVPEPDFGDCRFKENKARKAEWLAENAGKTTIGASDYEAIGRMVAAVRAHPLAGRIIRDGQPEVTVRWDDEFTGMPCKSRADYYVRKRRMVADLKSTLDARRSAFRKDVAKYRYHVQDALYRAGFAAIEEPVEHFVFVAVEKEPPHAIAIYALDREAVGLGYGAARRDIDTLAECARTKRFPGYPEEITELELPPWAA